MGLNAQRCIQGTVLGTAAVPRTPSHLSSPVDCPHPRQQLTLPKAFTAQLAPKGWRLAIPIENNLAETGKSANCIVFQEKLL